MLGEDEELIAGRRPVEEAFVARRPAHRLLVVPQRRHALEKLVLHATSLRLPIVELEGGTLTALAGFDGHQGVALVVEPRRYATLDEILARAVERGEPPFVLALDSLEDPQNVGTLLRSAEAAGVHGVLFPTHRQAPLTPSAVKASAGAVEHLLLAPVDDLAGALADLRSHGLRVAGADADAPLTARQSDLRGPIAIVVGSEGQGLGPAVRRRTDLLMRIPMRGAVGSLNAAVAGSILLFEAVAQRDPEGRDARRVAAALPPPVEAAEPVADGLEPPEPPVADAPEPPEPPEPTEVPDLPTSDEPARAGRPSRRKIGAATATAPPPEADVDELLPGEGPTSARHAPVPKAKSASTTKAKPTARTKPAPSPRGSKSPVSPSKAKAGSPTGKGAPPPGTGAKAKAITKPKTTSAPKTPAKPTATRTKPAASATTRTTTKRTATSRTKPAGKGPHA